MGWLVLRLFLRKLRRKMTNTQFTITKRIAKHGRQAVIIIPSILQKKLAPGILAQITFEIKEEIK